MRERWQKAVGVRDHLLDSLKKLEGGLKGAQDHLSAVLEAQVLVQVTAKETQEAVRFHIQDLVQSALDSVFPDTYKFVVEFELKRGRTEANLYLDKDGERLDPMHSTGGGVVDIIAFSLRLAAWTLSRSAPVMVLDEPFKFVSVNLRPLCAEILQGLSRRLGLQVIMVTHDPELEAVADRVFAVDQKNNRSFVEVK